MILSRELYQVPSLLTRFWYSWNYRSLMKEEKVKKLLKWDQLDQEDHPYFYSPRLALTPEGKGQLPTLNSDLCPVNAISTKKQVPIVDNSLCTRCHFCLESNPENFCSSTDLDHFLKT